MLHGARQGSDNSGINLTFISTPIMKVIETLVLSCIVQLLNNKKIW